jgi:hypothetical protein
LLRSADLAAITQVEVLEINSWKSTGVLRYSTCAIVTCAASFHRRSYIAASLLFDQWALWLGKADHGAVRLKRLTAAERITFLGRSCLEL